MDYSIHEHKHRFSAWAASRGATVSGCRFSVRQGREVLEDAGLNRLLVSSVRLPAPPNIDAIHREWRTAVLVAARRQGKTFTHGVAAKLINIYLKAGFVCGGRDNDPRVQALHPPIDRLLLDELYRNDVGGLRREWGQAREIRWSKFTSKRYKTVIASIRSALGANVPQWYIEKYWRGYQ